MLRLYLHILQMLDRLRLRRLARRYPGLEIHPEASSNLAAALYQLAPGARLSIGPRVTTERRAGRLLFHISADAHVSIGADTWLRTELEEVHLVAFGGARIEIGGHCTVQARVISAKKRVSIGDGCLIGAGCRIYDADQHALDAARPERADAVVVENDVWLASNTTILRGVRIGCESIVAAGAVVTQDVPPHTLMAGVPAAPIGQVGDRRSVRG